MANAKRIENDEAYERSLSWLVSKAIELEDPLLDPAKKVELQRKYDYVADAVQRYRRGRLVKEYPGLREQYRILGWAYDEPEEEQVQKVPEPAEPPQTASTAAGTQRTEPAAAALADWLDDD
jgi:hypothetical protein